MQRSSEHRSAGAPLEGRMFLVGAPRSGTTLLQSLLAAHPDVSSFTESHFFSRPFTHYETLGTVLRRNPAPQVAAFLAENEGAGGSAADWFQGKDSWRMRLPVTRPFETRAVARRLVAVLDETAMNRGATRWLEKTPRHLQRLPLLEQAVPGDAPLLFVHMVRNGLDTVASLYTASQHWERAYTLDECIDRWNEDLALTLARMEQAADQPDRTPKHVAITYEALVASPAPVLRILFEAIDLPWTPDILTDYGASAAAITGPSEHWKAGTARPIQASSTALEALSDEQREQAASHLKTERYDRVAALALSGAAVATPSTAGRSAQAPGDAGHG